MAESHPANVVFQAIGRDKRIADLDSLTNTPLYSEKRQVPCDDGHAADFIELSAVADAVDEDSAVELARSWIETHRTLLEDLDADLMLEFQTAITPKCGSNALVLPAKFVELLATINARLVHQYSRVVSQVEMERMRGEGRERGSDSPT
jgi:hypothetical protein